YNKGVVDELGGFRSDISSFGNDINEMRSFLLLPPKDYSYAEKDTEINEDRTMETSAAEQAIYGFLGSYIDEKTAEKNKEAAKQRIQSLYENIGKALVDEGLSAGNVEQNGDIYSFKIFSGSEPLYAVIGDIKSDETIIQSSIGVGQLKPDDLENTFIAYITGNKEEVIKTKALLAAKKTEIGTLVESPEISKVLVEKKLSMQTEPLEENDALFFPIKSSEGTELLSISLARKNGTYGLKDKTFETGEQLATALIEQLRELDVSTSMEKMIAARRAEIEAILSEKTFRDMLKAEDLAADTAPRAAYNQLLYDIKDSKGTVKFSFVIELSSGSLKVLMDNREIDLFTFLQGSKKKP
ncbi:hypothetical protein KJ951_03310, partial [Patescibacteria group bacterium]|nr:hypothetical protein [Patescibacteria group bacterium]MBU1703407.1 hypothetical protein [Patescibacteria group bacterium]